MWQEKMIFFLTGKWCCQGEANVKRMKTKPMTRGGKTGRGNWKLTEFLWTQANLINKELFFQLTCHTTVQYSIQLLPTPTSSAPGELWSRSLLLNWPVNSWHCISVGQPQTVISCYDSREVMIPKCIFILSPFVSTMDTPCKPPPCHSPCSCVWVHLALVTVYPLNSGSQHMWVTLFLISSVSSQRTGPFILDWVWTGQSTETQPRSLFFFPLHLWQCNVISLSFLFSERPISISSRFM